MQRWQVGDGGNVLGGSRDCGERDHGSVGGRSHRNMEETETILLFRFSLKPKLFRKDILDLGSGPGTGTSAIAVSEG
jgi:hypothetical protein